MKRTIGALTLAALVASVQGAGAVVTGEIFGPGSQSFPIAVTTLKNLGGDQNAALGQRFAAVLARDLDLSGYFRRPSSKTPRRRASPSRTPTSSAGRLSVRRRS